MSPLIGHSVESQLTGVLDGIVTGQIQLWEVTGAILGIYDLGYRQGIESQQPIIEQLERECDRLYVVSHNPPERARLIEARMRQAAERLPVDVLADSREGVEAQLRAATRRAA